MAPLSGERIAEKLVNYFCIGRTSSEFFAVRKLKIKNNLFPYDKELVSAVKLIFRL